MNRKETRKYPRVPVRFVVECRMGEKTLKVRAAILGGGGILLELENPPLPGAEAVLRFRPAKHLPYIKAKARVCYFLPGQGAAFEFFDLPPEDRHLLLRLVEHQKGDRRESPRVRLATQVQCESATWLAFSRDVSVGGMFIETNQPLPAGSLLTARFNLDNENAVVVVKGVVTYQVKKLGVGVQFLDLTPEYKQLIEAYVGRSRVLPEPKKRSTRAK